MFKGSKWEHHYEDTQKQYRKIMELISKRTKQSKASSSYSNLTDQARLSLFISIEVEEKLLFDLDWKLSRFHMASMSSRGTSIVCPKILLQTSQGNIMLLHWRWLSHLMIVFLSIILLRGERQRRETLIEELRSKEKNLKQLFEQTSLISTK